MKKKILVTGGAGFIGSNLVEELLKKDYAVTILDNFDSGYMKNLFDFKDQINVINGDIRDSNLVDKLVQNTSCVFHLAAMVSVSESVKDPDSCFDINVEGSLNVIDACQKYNSKFIFASSAAVYGENKTPIKTEGIITEPISPYGKSKLTIERICKLLSYKEKFEYTCFRNFNVYGPKQDVASSYAAVIPKFITNALNSKNLTIFGDGEQTRDFIYVKDICDAYILAYERNINGVYNLGCSDIESVNSLANRVISKINSNLNIIYKSQRDGDIKHSKASAKKYQMVSDWSAKMSLNNGIEKTIEYYKNDL